MILYFSVAPVSPLVPLGVHTKNRVRNVLSSLHFHFVDICYWRAERSVVKERTPLHDEKSCSVQDFRNLKKTSYENIHRALPEQINWSL